MCDKRAAKTQGSAMQGITSIPTRLHRPIAGALLPRLPRCPCNVLSESGGQRRPEVAEGCAVSKWSLRMACARGGRAGTCAKENSVELGEGSDESRMRWLCSWLMSRHMQGVTVSAGGGGADGTGRRRLVVEGRHSTAERRGGCDGQFHRDFASTRRRLGPTDGLGTSEPHGEGRLAYGGQG
jgi:hypothetical protein